MKLRRGLLVFLALAALSSARPGFGQEPPPDLETLKKTAPKIYVDCSACDLDFIKTEITFVNYVRERKEAQVHVLVTTQRTGSGGREYTLAFLGQNEFGGVNDTQRYYSQQTDTEEEIRLGLVKALKVGLMAYVARTPIRCRMNILYSGDQAAGGPRDRWKSWVFSLSISGNASGEQSYGYRSISTNISANRVTPEAKIRLSLSVLDSKDRFEYDGETIGSTYQSYGFNGLFVKSLGEHWSIGAYLKAVSSSYDNIRFGLSPAPALEYNFFPYAQATRRQLRCLYTLSFNAMTYREVTIYDKTRQNLWQQSLAVTFDVKEKWGSASTTLSGSHYFHDLRKYRLTLSSSIDLRLLKGFNVFVFGGGSRIHDQIFLPKGEASLEEVLLRRRQLETGYSTFFGVGLTYTFGSIFTNVVNPRFGSELGGFSMNID